MKLSVFWNIAKKPLIYMSGDLYTIDKEHRPDQTMLLYQVDGEWTPIILTADEIKSIKDYPLENEPKGIAPKIEALRDILPDHTMRELVTMVFGEDANEFIYEKYDDYFDYDIDTTKNELRSYDNE